MANDEKPGTNLASGSVIFVALVSTGFYFFHREAPLVDIRPVAEARLEGRAAPKGVEARLWQDPIGAVDKSREKPAVWEAEQRCQDNPGLEVAPCKLPLKGTGKNTVLGVTVPGAPYPEDVERRRRTRYAVLAGLERAGFVPEDRRHVGYFVWTQSPFPASFLSERPQELPFWACDTPSANHSACVSTASARLASSIPLFGVLQSTHSSSVQALPDSALADPAIVPYENFKKVSEPGEAKHGEPTDSVTVLWLKEDFFMHHPLLALSSLVGLLNRDQNPTVKFIGPFSSDMLYGMVNEALALNGHTCSGTNRHWEYLGDVKFYAYGASAPDKYLFKKLPHRCDSLRDYFENVGIDLQRTIATDDTLADGILNELLLRRVDPRPVHEDDPKFGHEDHIALISEWDTFYGQTLPKVVEHTFAPDDPEPTWIHKFSYLRGLDGFPPSSTGKEGTKQDNQTTSGEKQGGAPDFFKTEKDTQSLERPIGESQYDYLRRIGEHLHKIDNELRKLTDKEGHEKKIKAIGILGADVFDKLLILRALRPEFPEALFFTTDFDEAFAIKSELPFTRNLIISSSFGPNLSDWLQGDIPFFRDTHQTSVFLATQLALGSLHKKSPRADYASSDIPDQLRAPRVFEVKRSGEILPFAWVPLPLAPQNPDWEPINNDANGKQRIAGEIKEGRSVSSIDWPCREINGVRRCGNIQPVDQDALERHPKPADPKVIEELFPTYGNDGSMKLAAALGIGALLGLGALAVSRYLRKYAFVEVILTTLGLGAGASICAFWQPVAQYLTENGNGESISIFEGMSVWPTNLLRGFGIVLAIYFIWRAQRSLHQNLTDIASDMKLEPRHPRPQGKTSKWGRLTGLFDLSFESDGSAETWLSKVEASWNAYVTQEQLWPRCIRTFIYTGVLLLIYLFALVPLFGVPIIPARSQFAWSAHWYLAYASSLLMLFLALFVFDATLLCLLFVNKLRSVQTGWPTTTMKLFEDRLGLETDLLHDWIDLELVAKRTHCIGSLIYYPFSLIALLMVSRSTVFAHYAPSLPHLIVQGISLSIVFGCAVMLCWSAKAARDKAMQNLTEGIIRAKGHRTQGSNHAKQLETLLSRIAQLNDGAFSPLSQQPLVRALLFPLSGAGWVALIENGTLTGL
jgi:hypothetical protein